MKRQLLIQPTMGIIDQKPQYMEVSVNSVNFTKIENYAEQGKIE
jgi:hypothetical protein